MLSDRWRVRALALVVFAAWVGSARAQGDGDPLVDARNPELAITKRAAAVHRAWDAALAGEIERSVVRAALKELAWDLHQPQPVRVAAIEAVVLDDQATGDSRELVCLMLPTEPDRKVVAVLATAAARGGWTETTPALVRALAKPVPGVSDAERAEYLVLTELHPGREVAGVVLSVFLDPATDPGSEAVRLDRRVRRDAWDVLGRLAPDPGARMALLDDSAGASEASGEAIAVLRRCAAELRACPGTSAELAWLESLGDGANGANAAWWGEAASAVASLGSGHATWLELRHVEAVRWAAEIRPELLARSREELLDELGTRLKGRSTYDRLKSTDGTRRAGRESLRKNAERLFWGDVLAIRLIDEALQDPALLGVIFRAVDADRADTTTEHGGLLTPVRGAGRAALEFAAHLPRGSERRDDRQFVASEDMILASDRSLVHVHFHAARLQNRDYSGPSPEDLEYARVQGRFCLVLTSLSKDALDADVYVATGGVVDLGEVRRPREGE